MGSRPVRTVVSLRHWHDEDGEVLTDSPTLTYVRIPFDPWRPEDDDVVQFLRIVTTESLQPVLVHCAQGADRTGMMVAVCRIVVQGWSKEAALQEMVDGGFGFHTMWKDVQSYVRDLDVAALKAKVAALGPWKNEKSEGSVK